MLSPERASVRGVVGTGPAAGPGGGQRAGLALDHAVDDRRIRAAVQRPHALADLGVGLRDALVLADIFDPGRAVIALDPERRVGQVAQQRPVARAVAAADAAALRHGVEEGDDILLADDRTRS